MQRKFYFRLFSIGLLTIAIIFFCADFNRIFNKKQRAVTAISTKKTEKWIVATSIQKPTEDIKRLASLPGWTLVVVGDKRTPTDWNLPGEELGYSIFQSVPWGSYGRKNIGYLYAISNGAKWIYDTDDDNKPFGKGLEQFDYEEELMGLCFSGIENSSDLSDRLFNPYRHFGVETMWPRGFPLELIKEHTHKDGSYRLCKTMKTSSIQQGIVHKDPDVDAIYRLLHASSTGGLRERFNKFAPTVTLAPGTYSPINSQNTLFRRDAFFSLFLPLTVSFRVCDIWRGYYAQILLHIIGETIAFVPPNARQLRNAHNYLKDFDQEIDVYEKSGEILKFASKWKCSSDSIDKCMIDLAEEFAARKFWAKEEVKTIVLWINDLKSIGYDFPPLRRDVRSVYVLSEESSLNKNCRRAHFNAKLDLPENKTDLALGKVGQSIENFQELKDWCSTANSTKADHWSFPTTEKAAERFLKNGTLSANYDIVAIITNNYRWKISMGLLQRMYQGAFGHLIFCGSIPEVGEDGNDGMDPADNHFPKLRNPITYIHFSKEEVNQGYWMYYCMAKVVEMQLQNVRGYVMFSDDVVYNFWHPLNYSLAHSGGRMAGDAAWAANSYGQKAANRSIEIVKNKYANNKEILWMLEEYKRLLIERNLIDKNGIAIKDPLKHMNLMDGWIVSDWIYMPSEYIEFTRILGEIFFEGGLFHEIFFSKLMWLLPHEQHPSTHADGFRLLYGKQLDLWKNNYTEHLVAIHPLKPSILVDIENRRRFCDAHLDTFHRNLFGEPRNLGNFRF